MMKGCTIARCLDVASIRPSNSHNSNFQKNELVPVKEEKIKEDRINKMTQVLFFGLLGI